MKNNLLITKKECGDGNVGFEVTLNGEYLDSFWSSYWGDKAERVALLFVDAWEMGFESKRE